MQSANQQPDVNYYRQDEAITNPARPEPLIPERLSRRYGTLFRMGEEQRRDTGARAMLAAAFEELGNGVPAAAAATRSRDFYRSSGQPWTLGLSGTDA